MQLTGTGRPRRASAPAASSSSSRLSVSPLALLAVVVSCVLIGLAAGATLTMVAIGARQPPTPSTHTTIIREACAAQAAQLQAYVPTRRSAGALGAGGAAGPDDSSVVSLLTYQLPAYVAEFDRLTETSHTFDQFADARWYRRTHQQRWTPEDEQAQQALMVVSDPSRALVASSSDAPVVDTRRPLAYDEGAFRRAHVPVLWQNGWTLSGLASTRAPVVQVRTHRTHTGRRTPPPRGKTGAGR